MQVTMSNDAYFLLAKGEEPMDDLAYAEVERLKADGVDNFSLGEPIFIENGLVKVDLIPVQADTNFDPDRRSEVTKYCELQVKFVDNNGVEYRWVKNGVAGPVKHAVIQEPDSAQPYFITDLGSIIPIASLDS